MELKSQSIRLADVFFIGPLMTYGGWRLREDKILLGWALALLGIGTIIYNGRNYLLLRTKK